MKGYSVYSEKRSSRVFRSGLRAAIWGLSLALGTIFGSKLLGLDLFIVVRDSLPVPWRWLHISFGNYSLVYNSIHSALIGLLLLAFLRVREWRRILLEACFLTGIAAAVSLLVVEGLGQREGPHLAGLDLALYAVLAFLAVVLVEILIYFGAVAVLVSPLVRLRRWFANFVAYRGKGLE